MADITPEQITRDLQEKFGIGETPSAKLTTERKEEKETQTTKEDTIQHVETNDKQYSTIEQEAIEQGWNPNGAKSAEEFIRAEPLYTEIKQRGKEIKELKQTLDELKRHMDKQKEVGYQQAKRELQAQRREAIELGDVEAVDLYETQLKEYETSEGSTTDRSAPVKSFLERHKDWINDPSYEAQEVREFTQKRDNELGKFNLSEEEHMRVLEKDLKSKFPNRFNKESIEEPTHMAVESGSTAPRGSRKSKITLNDLSSEQRKCAIHFEKRKIMSVDQYIQSLRDSGEI